MKGQHSNELRAKCKGNATLPLTPFTSCPTKQQQVPNAILDNTQRMYHPTRGARASQWRTPSSSSTRHSSGKGPGMRIELAIQAFLAASPRLDREGEQQFHSPSPYRNPSITPFWRPPIHPHLLAFSNSRSVSCCFPKLVHRRPMGRYTFAARKNAASSFLWNIRELFLLQCAENWIGPCVDIFLHQTTVQIKSG